MKKTKTFNIKIEGKTFKIPICRFIREVLIKEQEDDYLIDIFNQPFFYVLLYNNLAALGTMVDVITQVYPAQANFIKNIIYGASDAIMMRDIIIRYNNQVNNMINWTKDNEDYIQTVIQEIQERKSKQQ